MQSEDSKNHVLNALLVLIASFTGIFGFYFVDGLVALFIGFIILSGSYELLKDIRIQEKDETINYEKYKLTLWKRYDTLQSSLLDLWLLNIVKESEKSIDLINELFSKNFSSISIKHTEDKEIVLKSMYKESHLHIRIKDMCDRGLIANNSSQISITEKGKKLLLKEISKQNHKIKPFGKHRSHFHR